MYSKISELAELYRISRDSIYAWIRQGLIPERCLIRIGNTIRIDRNEFESLMRAGRLWRARRPAGDQRLLVSEDQRTTRSSHGASEHRWIGEDGSVLDEHPFAPARAKLSRELD